MSKSIPQSAINIGNWTGILNEGITTTLQATIAGVDANTSHMTANPLLTTPTGASILFEGAPLHAGCQPAVLYFALSARMSLCQEPFNQPVLEWTKAGCRVFSWDLPFHDEAHSPQEAIALWAEQFAHGGHFIDDFIDQSLENIGFLVKQGLINPTQLGVTGLSRGGYAAVQLAARSPMIHSIVGFAPLTDPKPIDEFSHYPDTGVKEFSLSKLVPNLTHKRLRFYIGNRDIRVSTDACYAFIQALVEAAFQAGERSPPIELVIYPSIGHKGHGTPPSIFIDGAHWLQEQVIIR